MPRALAAALALLAVLVAAGPAQAAPVGATIVGGTTVSSANEVPWQAQLLVDVPGPGSELCGGTLITLDRVVTAAHCVLQDNGTPWPVGLMTVRAGTMQLGSGGVARTVAAATAHPSYDAPSFTYDAAVLRLATPLVAGSTIDPIDLIAPGTTLSPGTQLQVSGWGTTVRRSAYESTANNDPPSPTLKKVTIPVAASCGLSIDPAVQLCAGAPDKDACQGDSGGPLVTTTATPELAGIVSAGAGCAAEFPGVYTRVANSAIATFLLHAFDGLSAPVNTARPTLSGDLTPGSVLTCAPGAWTGEPNVRVRFLADGGEVRGWSTTLTYKIIYADVGKSITCEVEAAGGGGTANATSDPLGPVTAPVVVVPPPVQDVPVTNPTVVKPPPITDRVAPTARVASVRCTKRRSCVIDVTVRDPSPSAGTGEVRATVKTSYRATCKVRGRRRACTKTITKTLRVVPRPGGGFRASSSTLRRGTSTFRLVAVDAAGNTQAKATTVTRKLG